MGKVQTPWRHNLNHYPFTEIPKRDNGVLSATNQQLGKASQSWQRSCRGGILEVEVAEGHTEHPYGWLKDHVKNILIMDALDYRTTIPGDN